MEYSYNRLRGKIIEVYGTQGAFAEVIGISETALSKKMTGKTGFDQKDIVKWCNALNIPIEDAGQYFFA